MSKESDCIHFNANVYMSPKPTSWNMAPEKAAENSALAKVLASCLEVLPEKFHKLFVLKEIDGMIRTLEMNCKNIYLLISEKQNHPLPLYNKIRLNMHLAIWAVRNVQ